MQAIIDSSIAPPAAPAAAAAAATEPAPTPLPADARTAVVTLYRQHHGALVRVAALVAPDPANAEDLVQEAFLRLHRHWHKVDPEKAVGYVRATIINLARGQARRHIVALRHAGSARATEVHRTAESAEDDALTTERANTIRQAIRRLPARQRECLVLRHYLGMTESEIAAELGISIGSVRKHTQRGMSALDARLEALR